MQNKVFFSPAPTPVFLPKRPKTGLFLLSVRFCKGAGGALDVDGELLAKVYEIALFRLRNVPRGSRPRGVPAKYGLAPQQPVKVVALVGESPTRRIGRFTAEQPGACRPARRRGE